MDHNEYSKIDAINISSLLHLNTSPLMFLHRLNNPEPEKAVWALGKMFHCAILEPDAFESRYVDYNGKVPELWREIYEHQDRYHVYPGPVRNGKKWEAFQADFGNGPDVLTEKEFDAAIAVGMATNGREPMTPQNYETITKMVEALKAHKDAWGELQGGETERPVEWTDPITGQKCKGRVDLIVIGDHIGDLKKADDARSGFPIAAGPFGRICSRLLYHVRMAWYHWGCICAGLLPTNAKLPVLIPVQSTPPYDVGCYDMMPDHYEAGYRVFRELLNQLADCKAKNEWPGVCPKRQPLQLARWAAGMPTDNDELDIGLDWSTEEVAE